MTASAITSMVNKARDTAATRSPAVTAAATDLAINTAAVAAAVPATNSTVDTTRTVTTLTTIVLSQPATTRTAWAASLAATRRPGTRATARCLITPRRQFWDKPAPQTLSQERSPQPQPVSHSCGHQHFFGSTFYHIASSLGSTKAYCTFFSLFPNSSARWRERFLLNNAISFKEFVSISLLHELIYFAISYPWTYF